VASMVGAWFIHGPVQPVSGLYGPKCRAKVRAQHRGAWVICGPKNAGLPILKHYEIHLRNVDVIFRPCGLHRIGFFYFSPTKDLAPFSIYAIQKPSFKLMNHQFYSYISQRSISAGSAIIHPPTNSAPQLSQKFLL